MLDLRSSWGFSISTCYSLGGYLPRAEALVVACRPSPPHGSCSSRMRANIKEGSFGPTRQSWYSNVDQPARETHLLLESGVFVNKQIKPRFSPETNVGGCLKAVGIELLT